MFGPEVRRGEDVLKERRKLVRPPEIKVLFG